MQIDFFTRTGSVSETFAADLAAEMVARLRKQIGHMLPEIQFETHKLLLKPLLTAADPKSVGKIAVVQAACSALFFLQAEYPDHFAHTERLVAIDSGSGDLMLKPFFSGEDEAYLTLIDGLHKRVSPAVH